MSSKYFYFTLFLGEYRWIPYFLITMTNGTRPPVDTTLPIKMKHVFHNIFLDYQRFQICFRWSYGVIQNGRKYYNDVIISVMASQITSLKIVYSTVYSGAHQRKHQSSASLAFLLGIHRCEFPAQTASKAENASIWWRHLGCCEKSCSTSSVKIYNLQPAMERA